MLCSTTPYTVHQCLVRVHEHERTAIIRYGQRMQSAKRDRGTLYFAQGISRVQSRRESPGQVQYGCS